MFDGLRSRCTTPCACANAIASATGSSRRITSWMARPRSPARPPRASLSGGRVAVEPLEHHIGNERADRRGHRRARRDGARDVERAAREAVVDFALVAEASDESLDERRTELGLELQ